MTLAAVDLVVATCVACTTLALLLPLTFTAIILTPALKHFGLAPAAATSAHAAPADGTLLRLMRPMLQLYGAMVILGGACARVGASASALSVPIFHALSRDATLVAFLKQPLGPLDATARVAGASSTSSSPSTGGTDPRRLSRASSPSSCSTTDRRRSVSSRRSPISTLEM